MSIPVLLIAAFSLLGCGSEPNDPSIGPSALNPDVVDRAAVQRADSIAQRLIARVDSALRSIEPLSGSERRRLRRYVNADHLEFARRLGIEPVDDRRAAGALMIRGAVEDGVVHLKTNDYYIIDPRMGYAVPLAVTPAAHLLERVGRRFHQRLLAHGVPPYRFIVTNVLRTGIDQAHLRGTNTNATRGQSTHEYGTTFDAYYGRFHYAAEHDSLALRAVRGSDVDEAHLRRRLREAYRELGQTRAQEIKAVLGRALLDLQDDGLLAATYERRQPVFHVTVSSNVSDPSAADISEGVDRTAAMRRFYANTESQLADIENDIEDLTEESEQAGADVQAGVAQGISELQNAHDALRQEIERVIDVSPSRFEEVRPNLQRRLAELEGRIEHAKLMASGDAHAYVHRQLRNSDRAIRLLEGLLQHAGADLRDQYVEEVSALRTQHARLERLLPEMEASSASSDDRSAAAESLTRLTADLEMVSANVLEALRRP